MSNRQPSSLAWLMVHIVFPLVPFFIEGGIRFVVSGNIITWNTFSSATLAMSVGLLCMFVSQSLITHRPTLPSNDESERLIGAAHAFSSIAMICFVFFGILILLSALADATPPIDIKKIKSAFDTIVLVGAAFPILSTIFAQKSFKLSTSL